MPKYVVKLPQTGFQSCQCQAALAANPNQLDCPWCGCGWLFCCMDCGKPFLLGRVETVETPIRDLVVKDAEKRGYSLTQDDIAGTVDWWEHWLSDIPAGSTVVYLDGAVLRLDAAPIRYDGWYAHHDLAELPHKAVQSDWSQHKEILGKASYWFDHERPDRLDMD